MIDWITIPGLNGAYSVQSSLLMGVRIIKCCREAQVYNRAAVVANLKFVHNRATGTVTFESPFQDINVGLYDKHEKIYALYETT